MPRAAKAYIALVIASGTTVLLFAAGSWSSASLRQFAVYLGLAALSSTLKVRIPGIESTMSPNFIFLLLGMVACRSCEVVAISLVAALVQSVWAAKQPRVIQVAFSAASLVLSSWVAYQASHFLLGRRSMDSPVALVILAGGLYLPLNTALIAAVIGFVEGRPVAHVAKACYEYVFPFFIGGMVFAGLVTGELAGPMAWKGAIVLLPVVTLFYVYTIARSIPSPRPARDSVLLNDEER